MARFRPGHPNEKEVMPNGSSTILDQGVSGSGLETHTDACDSWRRHLANR